MESDVCKYHNDGDYFSILQKIRELDLFYAAFTNHSLLYFHYSLLYPLTAFSLLTVYLSLPN